MSEDHQVDRTIKSPSRRAPMIAWACAGAFVLILLTVTATVSFVVGEIVGQMHLYHSRASEQAGMIRAVLDKHGHQYAGLTIKEASDGWSYLAGTVETPEDIELLKTDLERAFGESLARRITMPVFVQGQPVDRSHYGDTRK